MNKLQSKSYMHAVKKRFMINSILLNFEFNDDEK